MQRFVAALTRANALLNSDREARIKYVAEYTKSKPELVHTLTLDRWTHTVNKDDLDQLIATLPRDLLAKVSRGVGWFLQLES